VWADVKAVMATPGELDRLTKELIYMAVSIANSCPYGVHSHTAAAKNLGITEAQHAEFLQVVSLAARTKHILAGLCTPIDEAFDKEHSA
jgi:AhpD family alkylhydroperoxidase